MKYDFDSMKDTMIDNGSYEKIDACVDDMMKTAYLCGVKKGMQQALLSLYKNNCQLLVLSDDPQQMGHPNTARETDKRDTA